MLTQIILRPDGRADMVAGKITAEFPTTDKRFAGLPRRHTTHVTDYRSGPFAHGISKWDWQRGRADKFDFGDHQIVEEFLFAPRGASEGDGWLVGTTLNLKARATEMHVFDAKRVSLGPLATWRADVPLPHSFHGIFVSRQ